MHAALIEEISMIQKCAALVQKKNAKMHIQQMKLSKTEMQKTGPMASIFPRNLKRRRICLLKLANKKHFKATNLITSKIPSCFKLN